MFVYRLRRGSERAVGDARGRRVQDVVVPVVAEPVALGPQPARAQGRRPARLAARLRQPLRAEQVTIHTDSLSIALCDRIL